MKVIETIAEIFNALSNPNRLKIITHFLHHHRDSDYQGSMDEVKTCMKTIGEDLDLAASTVSHHIKELRRAGILKVERKGKVLECRINNEIMQDLSDFFEKLKT